MKFYTLLAILLGIVCSAPGNFAYADENDNAERISVSEQEAKNYKNVATTVLKISLAKSYLPFGPHQGPGFVTGVGPVLQINWFKENKDIAYERLIPISSIISMDKILKENPIVFYKGPFGDTEYAIATEEIFNKIKGRWINYLVSQAQEIK